jgi:hypothetical protein
MRKRISIQFSKLFSLEEKSETIIKILILTISEDISKNQGFKFEKNKFKRLVKNLSQ